MAYVELVVKMPEEKYLYAKNLVNGGKENNPAVLAIGNGTPLPKGHGRLIDADKVIKKMEEREERLKDDRSIWETAGVETALDMFGETIIEADKAESEEIDVKHKCKTCAHCDAEHLICSPSSGYWRPQYELEAKDIDTEDFCGFYEPRSELSNEICEAYEEKQNEQKM